MNKESVSTALAKWDREKTMNEFIRERLGLESRGGKTHAEEIIDNAIERAKFEERPEWTKLLVEATNPKTNNNPQTNIMLQIATNSNSNIDELLNKSVSKVDKKGDFDDII